MTGLSEITDNAVDNPMDSGRVLAAATLLSATGIAIFAILPLLVGALVDHVSMTPQQGGFIASADILGMAVGNLAAFFWVRVVSWRKAAYAAVVAVMAANLLCATATDFETLIAMRIVAGLAEGSCLALTYAIVGSSSTPDRNYGLMIAVVLSFGALNVFVLSKLSATFGATVFFLDLAMVAMTAMWFIHYIPKQSSSRARKDIPEKRASTEVLVVPAIIALLANLIYFIGQGTVWTYLERIGIAHQLSPDQIASSLSLSLIAAVAGALVAAGINLRFGRVAPLTFAILVAIGCVILLLWNVTAATFFISVSLWNFVNNYGHPYLLGYMAAIDRTGKYIVASGGMQTGGMGLGPALAALVIATPTYDNVLWLSLTCFVITLAMFIPLMLLYRRVPETADSADAITVID